MHCRHAVDLTILQSAAEVCYTCLEYDTSIAGMQLISPPCSPVAEVCHTCLEYGTSLVGMPLISPILQSAAEACYTCLEDGTGIVGMQLISPPCSLSQRSATPASCTTPASACS